MGVVSRIDDNECLPRRPIRIRVQGANGCLHTGNKGLGLDQDSISRLDYYIFHPVGATFDCALMSRLKALVLTVQTVLT